MKKILSFILAALMTASCAAYVAADDAAVEATASNAEQDYAIEFLKNYKIFKGYNADETGAEDMIERWQMALFVSRVSTGWVDDEKWEDGTANNATFTDIEEGAAANYLGAISYANQNGIIEGYTRNTFAPYDKITYRDALTMVVRTLGYKGLTYPWGYIEKAVELDLTKGIGSDVAYTQDLTRGEVALIIYNAMFAKNSEGVTLAKSIFDIDFKWQNIIVVSTDEYTTVYDKDGNGKYADKDYIGFKTVSENAEIGDKIYYVKAEDMGLLGHDAERAVGSVYIALFEAVDGNFVTLVDSNSLLTDVVFNNGITDNAGDPYGDDMPIAKYLKDGDYVTVKSYTNDKVNYDYADLKVFGYGTHEVYDEDGNKTNVGIDFTTKNILKYDEDSKTWVVEWLYNDVLDRYYQYTVEKTTNGAVDNKVAQTVSTANTGDVYINWMDETEFNAWYANVVKKLIASYSELQLLDASATTMLEGKAPYAKLALFDIDNDDKAEVANYKTYGIGKFSNATKKCATCNADKPTYKITGLDDGEVCNVFVEDGHVDHDTDKTAGFAWVTVDDSVSGFENEDGTYNDGVVLYKWNKTTGEIEIVKYITEKATDDADSYIVTGIMQAYNAAKKSVTINGVNYPIAYANLEGDMYAMKDEGVAESARIGAILDEQYMQYVKAVVCDGYVVDTDLVGADSDFIVVLGYAGITSDGYIAVYGYSTDDVAMKVFKINSFNGWKKGDYRYYPTNAEEDDAFHYGTLYQIKSYDADTQSYGVYTENVSSALANAIPVGITFEDGYRIMQPMTINYKDGKFSYVEKLDEDGKVVPATVTKMDDKDNYIVVTDAQDDEAVNSNIYSYTGKIDYEDSFYGLWVKTGVDKKFVIYAATSIVDKNGDEISNYLPFFSDNAYQIGYVLYEKTNGSVISAAYDEAIGDWYLLGSTASEVRVLNLLTGNRDTVIAASNIDLVNGHIYKTVGGTILADITDTCNKYDHFFTGAIHNAYRSIDRDYATYSVVEGKHMLGSDLFVDSDEDGKLDTMNTLELAKCMSFVEGYESYAAAKAAELVKGVTLYVVGEDGFDWYAAGYHGGSFVAPLVAEDVKADYTYVVDFVYEVSSGKLVGYIYDIAEKGIEGIIAPPVQDTYTGTTYQGGSLDNYVETKTAWHLNTAEGVRYFDIMTTNTILVTYGDDDCLEIESMELVEIEMTLVEMIKGDDGKWTATPVNACGVNGNAIHDALAQVGMCFGNDVSYNDDNGYVTITVDGDKNVIVPVKYVDVYSADCGLAYKVVVKLGAAGKAIVMGDTKELVVTAGNIKTTFIVDTHYIETLKGKEIDITTDAFDNFLWKKLENGNTIQYSRIKAAKDDDDVIFDLSDKAPAEEDAGTIVIG